MSLVLVMVCCWANNGKKRCNIGKKNKVEYRLEVLAKILEENSILGQFWHFVKKVHFFSEKWPNFGDVLAIGGCHMS